ncbi:MAG: histidine kinase [Propionibacteriaceae bacterium]|nr:histidine kinase [Propionibacteriaceae bacterium]
MFTETGVHVSAARALCGVRVACALVILLLEIVHPEHMILPFVLPVAALVGNGVYLMLPVKAFVHMGLKPWVQLIDGILAAAMLLTTDPLIDTPEVGFALIYFCIALALVAQGEYSNRLYLIYTAVLSVVTFIGYVMIDLPQHQDRFLMGIVQGVGGTVMLFAAVLVSLSIKRLAKMNTAIWHENVTLVAQRIRTDERNRFAREMHDAITKNLYGSVILTEVTQASLAKGDPETAERLEELHEALVHTHQLSRELMKEMRTKPVHDLTGSFADIVARTAEEYPELCVTYQGIDFDEVTGTWRATLARMVAELLENVHRHAEAREVRVSLTRVGDKLEFKVRDDGKGMAGVDPVDKRKEGHFGLLGVREVAEGYGGAMRIDTGDWGTEVTLELPLEKRNKYEASNS